MSAVLKNLGHGLRFCAACAGTLLLWVLWLALAILLTIQIGIAFSHELAVPRSILRSIEARFAASHVAVHFGRATFDPRGRVLLERLQLSLPDAAEPIASVRAVLVELDPWLLAVGKVEPRHVRATGVTLFVPAMLAPSGRNEEMLSDIEFALTPADNEIGIDYLTGYVAGAALTVDGAVYAARTVPAGPVEPLPIIAAFARRYPDLCRQFLRAADRASILFRPRVHATLSPSRTRTALAEITLFADALTAPQWRDLSATEITASTRLPLTGDTPTSPSAIVSAAVVSTSDGLLGHEVRARIQGSLTTVPFSYAPREIEMSAHDVSARGFTLSPIALELEPDALPQLTGRLVADCLGSLLAVDGRADLSNKTASVHVDTRLTPALMEPVGAQLHRDLRPFIDFGAPVTADLAATFAPGWKFEQVTGRVAAEKVEAHGVSFDTIGGDVAFDGRTFVARHAYASLGGNFARGTFEQKVATQEFRFLLDGRLRPLAIAGWFRPWWTNFFEQFEFPAAPPAASVDVSGRWHHGHETGVFVFAESGAATIREAKFDRVRTRLFVRPTFLDGFELAAWRGEGELRGTFRRRVDLPSYHWRDLDLAFTSTIELENGLKLLGPELAAELAPISFAKAPQLDVNAHFDGPAAPHGEHRSLHVRARSSGDFALFRFPARNVSFVADVADTEIKIDQLEAEVAGGSLTGRARLWGAESDRRLGFDASLRGASLGRAVRTVSDYSALRRGEPPAGSDQILPGKNEVRLDLALSAEGRFDDFYSYQGAGNATLEGPELGEIRLLGLLSDLLNFTALRFTSARADFHLEGRKVVFPNVNVTGANSAILAHGDYWLDRHQLDFNARVYPFQESKSLIQSVVGAVLTPLSTVLEVKLTGPLEQPTWAFVIGPTNLLRSLGQTGPETDAPPGSPAPSPLPAQKLENSAETIKTH